MLACKSINKTNAGGDNTMETLRKTKGKWQSQPSLNLKGSKGQGMAYNRPPSPLVDKITWHNKRRSLSPKSVLARRPPSPLLDPQSEADMNRVKKKFHKALRARLYLLHQPGPHSFLIGGDSPEHKYKVIIGPQTCSCAKEPFCLHVLFVMLRVFKVRENDPMLWSRELKNYEVEGLFRNYQKRIELQSRKKLCAMKVKERLRHLGQDTSSTINSSGLSGPLTSKEDDDVCPICLLDMVEGESLTICQEGCHNKLHHHCMAIWGQECKRRKESLICPLCRAEWGPTFSLSLLKSFLQESSTQSSTDLSSVDSSMNSTDSSPALQLVADDVGLPVGDVIPEAYRELAAPWVQIFGQEMVNCLFSKDWKHREAGLRCMSRRVVKILSERKTTSSYRQTRWELLEVCASILKHVSLDPVYTVYVAALRALRAILTHSTCHTTEDLKLFCVKFQPVIENIVLKCADSNRRVTIVALKILQEFVKGSGNAPLWQSIAVDFLLELVRHGGTSNRSPAASWQWLLGSLVFLKKFLEDSLASIFGPETNTTTLPTPDSNFDMDSFLSVLDIRDTDSCGQSSQDALSLIWKEALPRLIQILLFCEQAIICRHKMVYKLCLNVLRRTVSILATDKEAFAKAKPILTRLNPSVKSVLQRQLSSDHLSRQQILLRDVDDDTEVNDYRGPTPSPVNSPRLPLKNHAEGMRAGVLQEHLSAMDVSPDSGNSEVSSVLTPPPSPNVSFRSQEDFDMDTSVNYQECLNENPSKCEEIVAEEEAFAIARALNVSLLKREVVPPQLMPVDEEVLIHVQPEDTEDGTKDDGLHTYLEKVHWRKGSLLGTGAYSSCFEAVDLKTGRLMAVKQVSFCRNSESEQDRVKNVVFEEISLLHRLKHCNVVRFLGATQHAGHFNIFMEYMPGGSIARLLGTFGPFENSVITKYTLQILNGVSYLHQNKTLHRDIKGANILVDSSGQVVKLSDFGTAARLLSQGTGTHEFSGQLLGTIAFMAPEVLRGERYGRKCDVWSIGCVIIEMATGKPPWGADEVSNHLALMYRIASSSLPPPIPNSLHPGLRDVALRCFETDQKNRASSSELLGHPVFRT